MWGRGVGAVVGVSRDDRVASGHSRESGRALRLLIISLYWPPAGGPGVQRPLKLAGELERLGVDVHVLAPDDPKWLHRDESAPVPAGVTVHRAWNLGPRSRRPAEELRGREGLDRLAVEARLAFRRALVPDAAVLWNVTSVPTTVRLVRELRPDWVLTTSPPGSIHLAGAVAQRLTGVRWAADLRDSIAFHPHRRHEVRGEARLARLVARRADAIVCAAPAIAAELRGYAPCGPVQVVENGCDFDDFAGLEYRPATTFRITHTGSFFGLRDPRPFLDALARVEASITARFVGDFRTRDREYAEGLGLGNRLELVPYLPRREALALQRDSEALLLLIPEARGRGVLTGKIFEYLASERPILAAVPLGGTAAELIEQTRAGPVVAPDDVEGIARALGDLERRHRAGALVQPSLSPEVRVGLSRMARAKELLAVLEEAS